jgi:hypothetical protein
VKRALALSLLVGFVLAGCGASDATTDVRVYVLRDGKVWPVARAVEGDDPTKAALDALVDGPTTQEQDELGATTALPADLEIASVDVADGVATVELSQSVSRQGLAQVVYTATQTADVKSVDAQGGSYERTDFERLTPQILVESPLAFDEVSSPLRVRGTANTFEATFEYELKDADGKVIAKHFVTATSGNGTRGTFDFSIEYSVDSTQDGTLVVFERSAADGSRIHDVSIPLTLTA